MVMGERRGENVPQTKLNALFILEILKQDSVAPSRLVICDSYLFSTILIEIEINNQSLRWEMIVDIGDIWIFFFFRRWVYEMHSVETDIHKRNIFLFNQ